MNRIPAAPGRKPLRPLIRVSLIRVLALSLVLIAPLPVAAAAADSSGPEAATAGLDPRFAQCLARAEATPTEAEAEAQVWEQEGGGFAAQVCQAMVLFHRGQFDSAAIRLEELAAIADPLSAATALTLRSRAAWAWLRAGQPQRAIQLYDAALAVRSDDLDLWIDRAFAHAETGAFAAAVDDLTQVVNRNPGLFEAWLYRAGAYRHLENYPAALDDAEQALSLRPADSSALLLRGNLRALSGDSRGALDDWRRVITLAPQTPAAQAAAANTTRLSTQEALPAVPAR
mgnify:CR=1 FL=1